jgi:DNA polymerase-1
MTTLRLALLDAVPDAEIVFFQHDELVVHAVQTDADRVSAMVVDAARRARDLVFPGSEVSLPVRPSVVRCYADAK